ncbi:hypothetical protein PUN4_180017 [Paraburkholderia unamae]|nr:hypothetical protein PUN4_180017 [Paraburkholderia unamae]
MPSLRMQLAPANHYRPTWHLIRLDAGRQRHPLAGEPSFQERVTLFRWLYTRSLPIRHALVGYD